MKKVSERLKYFIYSQPKYNGSIREFERQIGWKNATVNQFSENPKKDKIDELKNHVPNLNIAWQVLEKICE